VYFGVVCRRMLSIPLSLYFCFFCLPFLFLLSFFCFFLCSYFISRYFFSFLFFLSFPSCCFLPVPFRLHYYFCFRSLCFLLPLSPTNPELFPVSGFAPQALEPSVTVSGLYACHVLMRNGRPVHVSVITTTASGCSLFCGPPREFPSLIELASGSLQDVPDRISGSSDQYIDIEPAALAVAFSPLQKNHA
jgi:hypothetical protein